MQPNTDIAICGAGPVGLALAALLVKHGLAAERITLIDGKTLAQSQQDPRAIALSYGSRQILQQAGIWPEGASEIHQIHVSRKGHFGRTLIDRSQHHLPALGYVHRYGTIVASLAQVCQDMGIPTLRPMQLHTLHPQADSVLLQLQAPGALNPFHLKAGLMIQAEGGLFGKQPQKTLHRDYQQTAIIAQVRTSAPLPHRAFERFTDEGPLALLPNSQGDEDNLHKHSNHPSHHSHDNHAKHGYALVWCVKPPTAERLLALDETAFLHELSLAFGSRLGQFISATPRMSFVLGLNANIDETGTASGPDSRILSIGNAAQTLHPVAGQGLNLGLRDALVLAKILAQDLSKSAPSQPSHFHPNPSPHTPDPASLTRFRQARRNDRSTTVRLTDTMARIFATADPASQGILGLSLGLLDAFEPAKHVLAELMMFGRR